MDNKFKKIQPLIYIVVLAFAIRLIGLNQSLWLDEAAQALESARPLSQQFDIVGDFQPPLLHLIVHFFYQISNSDWFLRLPSVIAGVITVLYVYKITHKLFGEKAAIIAGLLGATSPYHIYFSQELRQYSLPAAFGAMSMWYLINWFNTKSDKISWGYILSTTAGMYSMYVFPFLILTQLLYVLFFQKKKLKSFIKSLVIIGLFFSPWLPMFSKQLQAGIGLKNTFIGWSTAVSLPLYKALPLTAIRFLIGMIPVDFVFWQIGLFIAVGIGLYQVMKDVLLKKKSKLITFWLIGPIVLTFIFSFAIPVLEPKRLLYALPALWILLAAGIQKKKNWKLILGIFLTTQVLLVYHHLRTPTLQREDWKEAVSFVENYQASDKAAVFAFPNPFGPWEWYEAGSIPAYATRTLTVPSLAYLDEAIGKSLDHDTIIVFEYLMDLSDPHRYIFTWLDNHGYTNTQIKDVHGVGFIYIYQRSIPTAHI